MPKYSPPRRLKTSCRIDPLNGIRVAARVRLARTGCSPASARRYAPGSAPSSRRRPSGTRSIIVLVQLAQIAVPCAPARAVRRTSACRRAQHASAASTTNAGTCSDAARRVDFRARDRREVPATGGSATVARFLLDHRQHRAQVRRRRRDRLHRERRLDVACPPVTIGHGRGRSCERRPRVSPRASDCVAIVAGDQSGGEQHASPATLHRVQAANAAHRFARGHHWIRPSAHPSIPRSMPDLASAQMPGAACLRPRKESVTSA